MQPLFRIRELSDGQPGASFFWIESTAPLQVEGDPPLPAGQFGAALKELPDATAITDVAKRISEQPRPHVDAPRLQMLDLFLQRLRGHHDTIADEA